MKFKYNTARGLYIDEPAKEVEINTIEDLQKLWESAKGDDRFYCNDMIVDFEKKTIIYHNDWIE